MSKTAKELHDRSIVVSIDESRKHMARIAEIDAEYKLVTAEARERFKLHQAALREAREHSWEAVKDEQDRAERRMLNAEHNAWYREARKLPKQRWDDRRKKDAADYIEAKAEARRDYDAAVQVLIDKRDRYTAALRRGDIDPLTQPLDTWNG